MEINGSNIFIVNDIENTLAQVVANLPMHSSRIIQNEEKSEFLMAQANATIKEAYIATNQTKYIILCGSTFRHEAQNALLKVLEEPPKNVIFIIITTSKSAILPTILSRVPHKYLKKNQEKIECEINFLHLDLKEIYSFLKQNQKISKQECKALVESMLFKINQQKIQLTNKELETFSTAIKLLELNSRPIHVLSTLLLTLSQRKQ